MSVFGVILVGIFPHLDWITPNTDTFNPVIMENKDLFMIATVEKKTFIFTTKLVAPEDYKMNIYTWRGMLTTEKGIHD